VSDCFRVGIVGLQPDRGWASQAHIPALRALSHEFAIMGVANTSEASARRAAAAAAIPNAYAGVSELLAAPNIDIVTITVRVPFHFDIAMAAMEAGKHVYCEWPVGNGLAEAERLAEIARLNSVIAVAGTQAPFAPEIEHLRHLIVDGFVGEVLSTTLVARGGTFQGGGTVPDRATYGYLLDRTNGATMLTVPVGHTLAALTSVLGDVAAVSAVLATRRTSAFVENTGEMLPVSAPDEVLVSGLMASGAPLSIHYRGGASRDEQGFLWEIHGTRGDIRVTGPSGQTQMVQLSLSGSREQEKVFAPLNVPESDHLWTLREVGPRNVARVYACMASDLRNGSRLAPSFDDALKIHRIIAAIEKSAESGTRIHI
jgi:predicted dehydrogenase